jgi:hypothetical protein
MKICDEKEDFKTADEVKTKFLAAKTLNEEREREELRSLYLN